MAAGTGIVLTDAQKDAKPERQLYRHSTLTGIKLNIYTEDRAS